MIWLIGSKGILGSEIAKQLTENGFQWTGTDREQDITRPEALENYFNSTETASYYMAHGDAASRDSGKIKWVINCAGYNDIDSAENDRENAEQLNTTGAENVARITRAHSAKLITFSSEHVFDGKSAVPYTEEADRNPQNVYGLTKCAGEDAVRKQMTQYYILRTSWMYGNGDNSFINRMTAEMNNKKTVTVDGTRTGCPTSASDIASAAIHFIYRSDNAKGFFGSNSAPAYGVYNFCDEGSCTLLEYAQAVYKYGRKFNLIQNDCTIESGTVETAAKRPQHANLDTHKIEKELKIRIPSWQTSLEKYFRDNRK